MYITPITSISQTSNYMQIQPLMAALKSQSDQLPKNSLPTDYMGSIQQNAEQAANPKLTIYNTHGIVTPSSPNSLIAYA